ncbi:MAG: AraC family transcriptional regulator [Lachnospiraceae bacterium]|nr:AraC family transcriptional regulator [Lachnospiraceae bacterium]
MFEIINGGVYTKHDKTFSMDRPKGFEWHVLLMTRSRGEFHFDGKTYEVLPYQVIMVPAKTPYHYRNPSGEYSDDWLHFSCSKKEFEEINPKALLHPFSIGNPSLIGSYFQQLLYEKNYAPEHLKASHMDGLFHILINHLMYDFHEKREVSYSPYLHPMQSLRLELQSSPWHSVPAKEAAKRIGISLSYFQHLYTEFFQISYQKDVISMKIAYSEELLKTTNMSIEEIARACGYTNPVHFYRQFQDVKKMTPGQYRG